MTTDTGRNQIIAEVVKATEGTLLIETGADRISPLQTLQGREGPATERKN